MNQIPRANDVNWTWNLRVKWNLFFSAFKVYPKFATVLKLLVVQAAHVEFTVTALLRKFMIPFSRMYHTEDQLDTVIACSRSPGLKIDSHTVCHFCLTITLFPHNIFYYSLALVLGAFFLKKILPTLTSFLSPEVAFLINLEIQATSRGSSLHC